MQGPPQKHCPAQDEAQPFSKGSSGWESHKLCPHSMFLCDHCIIPWKTQETAGFLGMPLHGVGIPEAPKGHSQCSVLAVTVCTQHGEAVRPYLGKLSRFSAAALAACGSPRHVPSQPTRPGTRRSSSGNIIPALASPTVPSSSTHRDITPFWGPFWGVPSAQQLPLARRWEKNEWPLPGLGSVWKCPQSAPRWRSCCCWPLQGQARSDLPS